MKTFVSILLLLGLLQVLGQTPPAYIPANGLMAWWPYDGNAMDESGNGNHGIATNATLTADRFNSPNKAYAFNGVNSVITVPDKLSFRPANFTISSWIYLSSLNGTRMVLSKNCGVNTYESIGMYLGSNKLNSITGTPTGYGQNLIAPNILQTGKWYNFLIQFDDVNNVHKLFLDGVLTYTAAEYTSVGYDSKPWTIGMEFENNTNAYYFDGKIDDIGVWDRLLSNTEIVQVYQGGTNTNIKSYGAKSGLQLFPNPANEQLTVKINADHIGCRYLLIDCLGNEITNGTFINELSTLNITQLKPGIYLLKIEGKNDQTIKFVKN